jgi:hypothetical protein
MRTGSVVLLTNCALRILVMFVTLVQACSLQAAGQSVRTDAPNDQDIQALVDKLLMALGSSHGGVEIQLRGYCVTPNSEVIEFPPFAWDDAGESGDPLARVGPSLRKNAWLSVARVSPNVILVRDSRVPEDLLETRIDSLVLPRLERYSPEAAISAAINSRAIQLALRRLKMRSAVSMGGLQHLNANGAPHLQHHVKNVTLNGFLSSVLGAFGGIVVYEDCVDQQGERRFDISYYK